MVVDLRRDTSTIRQPSFAERKRRSDLDGAPNLDQTARSQHFQIMRRKVRSFNVVIERDRDGYYVGSVPELRGCHTQAKSLDVLLERTREVIDLCIEVEAPRSIRPSLLGCCAF